jgi:hypothetical protein
MGIHLAKRLNEIYWLQMIPSYADRLVLHRMAHSALDVPGKNGEPACLYFGGRDPLILALSDGNMPEPKTPAYKTQSRKVSGCIQRLIKAGAIERIEEGRRDHNSVYKLNVGGGWRGT